MCKERLDHHNYCVNNLYIISDYLEIYLLKKEYITSDYHRINLLKKDKNYKVKSIFVYAESKH